MSLSLPRPLALYIHWPFCVSKCPYCDFNSHVRDAIVVHDWRNAYLRALTACMANLDNDYILHSIFFGGGTPSLMPPQLVEDIISHAQSLIPCVSDIEITLEANPGSVERGNFSHLRQAGVNRLSLGLQALNDDDLRYLGRLHTVKEALQALDVAQNTFDRVSFDLIYARRADHTLEQWRAELAQALSMGTTHMSLYQLTIEPNTAFSNKWKRKEIAIPNEGLGADLYELTAEMTKAAGFTHYEVSNYAKPGQECRHNMIYWRYHDFIGVGPGAHGRLTQRNGSKIATTQFRAPETWLIQVQKMETGYQLQEPIDVETQTQEAFVMGLRLTEGVNYETLPHAWETFVNSETLSTYHPEFLEFFSNKEKRHAGIRTTPKGRLCLDAILRGLFG